ncbi:hypothetical protein HYG82_02320 [Natrinema halophilum]|uniref:Uncharacterized protein n=2 Tax=Natrinema halophilum TaxID=1699371 RepID=A0A7D5KYN8_9EURY|nr:hypothetical protein [Natrinema halophilum]QLG51122.1 hypothetical protein HYG82_02320 [Natrinema halophilum]
MRGTDDESKRAAATCKRCSEIGVVKVWPDGRLRPLGRSNFCDCDSPTLEVFESDLDHELP